MSVDQKTNTTTTIDTDEFELEIPDSKNYEKQMLKSLPAQTLLAMKKLAYYIATVGLSFEDSCELIRYEPEEVRELIKTKPAIGRYLRLKEIELKKDLLKIISLQAKEQKNDKWAEWVLRSRYPEEFGTSKQKNTGNENDDVMKSLTAMMQTIRRDANGNMLVEEKRITQVLGNNKNPKIGAGLRDLGDKDLTEAKEAKKLIFSALN